MVVRALLVRGAMRVALITFTTLLAMGAGCATERPEDANAGDGGPDAPGPGTVLDDDWHPTHAPAMALAADGAHVYYATYDRIERVAVGGGAAELLYTIPPPADGVLLSRVTSLYLGPSELVFVLAAQGESSTTKSLMSVPRGGGAATLLAQSGDVRAFLGVAFDAEYVYYSSFTSIARVPRGGGTARFVGQSDQSVRYWVFSPVVTADAITWAEGGELFRMPKSSIGGEGTAFASLPGVGAIIAREPAYVVALSDQIAFQGPPSAAVVVDPTTGSVGPVIELPGITTISPVEQTVAATPDHLYTATLDGLWQSARTGGAPTKVLDGAVAAVAAGPDGVYVATQTAVARVAP